MMLANEQMTQLGGYDESVGVRKGMTYEDNRKTNKGRRTSHDKEGNCLSDSNIDSRLSERTRA